MAALAARIAVGFVSLGADHPNETYRLLEPLAATWGFATRLPWEWTDGLLSTLPVRAHELWLAWVAPGAQSALSLLFALKLTYALVSLFPILATWRLLSGKEPAIRLAGTAFVAFWPEFVYRSVRLMDYSLEAALLALAVIFAFTCEKRRALAGVAAGVALGLAFFVRFQSGLYFVAILLAFALRPRSRIRSTLALTCGYGATIALLAAYESHLTGASFLSPFFKYIHFNWAENGAARLYGVAPWHRYLSEALKAYGFLPFLLFVPAAALAATNERGRSLAILFFLPLLALSLVAHKEGRFEFGFLWLLVPLAGLAPLPSFRALRVGVGVALVIGFAVNLERVSRRLLVHADDVRQWAGIGERIAAMPEARRPSYVVVQDDPDAVPGGFFLRLHGSLCYQYRFEGMAKQAGSCAPGVAPDALITRDSGSWGLETRQP